MNRDGGIPAMPLATYRLQFTPRFRFDDARAIAPYLARLGVDTIYASPYLKARPGSEHGYDVVDPNRLNPEIGSVDDHAAFIDAAQASGLGHLLDFVPNHMGVGGDNPWWQDVLEWGEASPYAEYFDINWRPLREEMRGRVLVPALGDYYGRALERGELVPRFEAHAGTFWIEYFDRRFPLSAASYGELLARAVEGVPHAAWPLRALAAEFASADRERALSLKEELAEVARDPAIAAAIERGLETYRLAAGETAIDRLDDLLGRQNYRLSYWRVSADEINYRRFFDINDLVGVRVEDAEVLGATHRLAFDLIAQGRVQGLRIDHVDGLYNPGGYCALLHDRAEALGQPLYLVVEKILARGEQLRADWRIDGTTGYDFMAQVNGLFVDGHAEAAFDRLYRRFAGISGTFEQFAYRAKKDIIRTALASEIEVLATMLDAIAGEDRASNDYTYNVLRDALVEVVASFPVYRTYVASERVAPADEAYITAAVDTARKRSEFGEALVFDFIRDLLTLEAPARSSNYDRRSVLRFAMKFQQYTSPVMAKAVEDTAYYRYVRLVSLNEVGGDPRHFGTSPSEFHAANAARAKSYPHAMLATATHDHKRGEDTRARIDALSEMPDLWDRAIRRWNRANARRKGMVDGAPAPTENDEYFIYQTLLGTLPFAWLSGALPSTQERDAYLERIVAYQQKAMREAKFRTSWTNPNQPYEAAAEAFVRDIFENDQAPFVRELCDLARSCATIAAVSGLAQTTLKFTSPGVPDIYQGCELWDLTLVDPDNRRPVDYTAREAMVAEFERRSEPGVRAALVRELLDTWRDGRIKAYVIWQLLHLRQERRATFSAGDYVALETRGRSAAHLLAFARDEVVVVVPRLVRRFVERADGPPAVRFSEERIVLPAGAATRYRDRFTGESYAARDEETRAWLPAGDLLGRLPVAVLEPA